MAKDSNKKIQSFEEAIDTLEDIVERLESGNLPLDDSIRQFEEAMKLIGYCEKKIASAKQKVKILTEASDGTITDAPFVAEDLDET